MKRFVIPAFLLIDAPTKNDADIIAGDIAINVNNRFGQETAHRLYLDEVLPTYEISADSEPHTALEDPT